ncbi:DNA helicase-2/ATP-dependent DNA helicase PcrA [Paraburkholderia sp. GAS206C]|uniref:UvrD-helicase domain-containing protein n=1 Tax=unclassified Paraburkholderia TaxID=2615204 RepID=UPI003D217FBA
MSSAATNSAILAAAGSRKTQYVVDSALAVNGGRVLITTYTNENQRQIIQRIEQKVGFVPPNISVVGWFSFLITQCAKPYQRAKVGQSLLINGLNFIGSRSKFAKKSENKYFLDGNNDLYRDGVSDFVVALNGVTSGAVVRRLENIYTHIFIDEVQDLVGYDLDVLDMLMTSTIRLTLVGDPRQHTLSTNIGPRNKKYRGAGIKDWFEERAGICELQTRDVSYRCNQIICDFADAIYPCMPKTRSSDVSETGHDGIFFIPFGRVQEYLREYSGVVVLRHDKRANTLGIPAMNIGVSKGSTFDRVVIFPTKPMVDYLKKRDPAALKAPERLYVAVTRARFSVAFVVDDLSNFEAKVVAGNGG